MYGGSAEVGNSLGSLQGPQDSTHSNQSFPWLSKALGFLNLGSTGWNADQSGFESSSLKQESLQGQDSDNTEAECDVISTEMNSSPIKHHLVIYNDGTTQLVPSKRIKSDRYSSTSENIIIQASESKTVCEDANELFLRSLLPDMSKLNSSKLRHFKTFVITKLTNLLDEQDAENVTRDLTDGLANTYVLESSSVES
ncbi:uncharacterized protein TNCV_2250491 [Trichonephila clavipes]|nr:uncharacterized protein TNCV_2250491 [Trichonephila clavipes]